MKYLIYIVLFIALALPGLSVAQSGDGLLAFEEASITEKNRIELYPNPAVSYINIQIRESELSNPQFVLYSIIGNEIKIEPEVISDNKFRIELKELPAGYYLLSIKDSKTNFKRTYKFLKR